MRELGSINVFLCATWGIAILGLILRLLVVPDFPDSVVTLNIVMSAAFFLGLIVSAIVGSKAAKLGKAVGISVSQRG